MNSYDLEIENYSFQDLVDLFEISNKLTIEDLKKASRTAIMMHPDKSGLDNIMSALNTSNLPDVDNISIRSGSENGSGRGEVKGISLNL